MSKQVDERVVSMQFDNRNFEKNVQTSMSTLDKLKAKLNLNGAAKGLENVNSAAKKVDMSGLNNGIETVRTKFSALEVMGVTALANITNSAVNAGKRIVSALTIDPIKTGFQEYETQINAVQTILANTQSKGTTLDDVNKALDELNTYADKTIYNFTEMTRNIGTFTAAGVDLETSTNAIQGIANLAAVSGSTSQQASTAMYQLSQALSSGTVKLMDWNSVVNAGMGGQVFQDALKETARVHGVAIDDMIKKNGSFRETLKDGWLTSEILTETLQKFTLTTEGLTEEQIKANREMLKAKGYTDEQIDGIFKLGDTATNAATKVKTFTQLWDVLKEAAQSGWAKTWKLIIGDFEEAKGLLTPLADFLTGFINKMSDWRNSIIEAALSSPFADMADKIKSVTKKMQGAADKTKEITKTVTDLGDVVNKVIRGDFGNGEERFKALTEAGYNWKQVQNKVNEELGCSYRYTVDLDDAQKNANKTQKESTETQADTIKELVKMSDAQLKALGLTKDEIEALRMLEEQSRKAGIPLEDVLKDTSLLDGRTMLINSFKNAWEALSQVFTAIGDAWKEVFPPKSIEERAAQIYNIITAIHKFSTKLKLSEENVDKLKRTFKGLFALLDIVLTLVGGPLKIAFKAFTQLLGMFDLNLLDVTAMIGDAIVGFRDFIDSTLDFTKVFEKIMPFLKDAAKGFRDWISGIKEADNIPKYIIQGLANGIRNGAGAVWDAIVYLATSLIDKFKSILGIHSPSVVFAAIGGFIIAGLISGLQNGFPQVGNTINQSLTNIVNFIKNIDFGAIFAGAIATGVVAVSYKIANAMEALTSPLEGVGDFLTDTGKGIRKALTGLGKTLSGVGFNLKMKGILNLAIAIGILAASVFVLAQLDIGKAWNAVGIIATLSAVMMGIAIAIGKFGPSSTAELGKFSLAVMAISVSLLLMSSAVKKLSGLSWEEWTKGLGGIVVLLGVFTGIAASSRLLGKNIDKFGGTILKIAAAILLMVFVAKIAAGMSEDELVRGGLAILAFGGIIVGLMAATKLISGSKNVDKLGSTILKIAGALLVMITVAKIAAGMSTEDLIKGGLAIVAFGGIILGMMAATKLINGSKNVDKIGGTILKIAGAMLLMVLAAKIAAGMSTEDLIKGGIAVAAFGGIVVGLMAATKLLSGKDLTKVGTTILLISVSIAIMAGVAALLGMLKIESLAKGIIAIGILAGMVAGLIYVTKFANNCKGNITAIAIVIGVMAASIVALSFIDASKLAGATIALSLVMGMFALLIKVAGSAQAAMGPLIVMTAAITLLGTILIILAHLPIESSLAASASLSILLLALAVSMAIIGKIGKMSVSAMASIAVMTIVVVVLASVLKSLSDLPVDSTLGVTQSLVTLLLGMSAALVVLSIVGLMGPAAFIGIGALATLIVGIGGLIAGIGALVTEFPQLETFLNTGIPILEKIGLALGSFFGNIIGGFIDGVASSLPGLGTCLSQFMINATPFITGIKMVDGTVLEGVGILAAAVLALAATDFIASIMSFLQGGESFSKLGTELSAFITNAMPFIVNSRLIKPEIMTGVKTLAEAILILTGANMMDRITSWLGGEASLSTFGSQLGQLGTDLSTFVTNLGTFSEEQVAAVDCAGKAIKALANAASTIPNEGGWVAAILGDNSLATFGSKLPKLGTDLAGFITNLGTFSEEHVTTVDCAGRAIKALAEAASEIPNEGGWAAGILGDNSLATFGSKLPALGKNLNGFITNLGTFGEDSISTVNCAGKAIKALASAASEIPNEGGWAAAIVGDNSLATFGSKLPQLAKDIAGFVKNLGTFGEDQIATIKSACSAIKAIVGFGEIDLSDTSSGMEKLGKKMKGFAEKLSAFVKELGDVGADNITSAVNKTKDLIELAKTAAGTNVDSLSTFGKSLKKVATDGVNGFVKEFTGESPKSKVKKAATTLLDTFIKGAESKKSDVTKKFKTIGTAASDAVGSKTIVDGFKTAGKDCVTGFANGIKNNKSLASDAGTSLGKAALKAAKAALKEKSPSRAMYEVGAYAVDGFVNALNAGVGSAYSAGGEMADSARKGLSGAISKITDVINGDLDAQPTITPVLDLSNVQSGASAISGMLSGRRTLAIDTSNIGAVSALMSGNQNGRNSADVVSAIKGLRKDIANMPRNTYSIGGITYGEGTEVADAINTLVRAAKMERRT